MTSLVLNRGVKVLLIGVIEVVIQTLLLPLWFYLSVYCASALSCQRTQQVIKKGAVNPASLMVPHFGNR